MKTVHIRLPLASTCSVLQVKSDCSSPHTLSAATTSTMTRKMNSTESQTLPRLVEWRLTPASWAYRAGQDILRNPAGTGKNKIIVKSQLSTREVVFFCTLFGSSLGTTHAHSEGSQRQEMKPERGGERKVWKRMKRNESERRRREGPPPAFMWTDEPLGGPLWSPVNKPTLGALYKSTLLQSVVYLYTVELLLRGRRRKQN